MRAAKAGQIDLVIMDIGLPDIDGREAVRILRKNGFKAPIIMLTGHDTNSDTILGLESGANDYVTKPFRFAVLLARIRAQLRQHETSEDAVFTIGPYTFRPRSKLLLNPMGNKVRLTEKETSILRYLYREPSSIRMMPPAPVRLGPGGGGSGTPTTSRNFCARSTPRALTALKQWSLLRLRRQRRPAAGIAGDAVAGSLGLQFGSHHAHARDAHLSITAKDREGRRRSGHPGH